MSTTSISTDAPKNAAIIGSGPAGLYTATELLKAYPQIHIDIFDQNWAPFGLIRYGVAPDHQKTKRVTTLLSKTLLDSRVRFFGGLSVGQDIPLKALDERYALVVVATGAEKARHLDLPEAENFPTGLDIVTWYNGHPSNPAAYDFNFDSLVIVGNGNVALDIARLLCQPEDVLRATDLPDPVLEKLLASKVRDIHIIGRRGPAQIAFRPPELKELAALKHVQLKANSLAIDPIDQEALEQHEYVLQKKGLAILREATTQVKPDASHRIHLHFNRQPLALYKDKIELGVTTTEGAVGERQATLQTQRETIACSQIIQSIGYFGTAPEGLPQHEESGLLKTRSHRVEMPQEFNALWVASGWLKTGPRGLIGHNHMDAVEVIRSFADQSWNTPPCPNDIGKFLHDNNLHWIDAQQWSQIDSLECENGQERGKTREKFIQTPQLEA